MLNIHSSDDSVSPFVWNNFAVDSWNKSTYADTGIVVDRSKYEVPSYNSSISTFNESLTATDISESSVAGSKFVAAYRNHMFYAGMSNAISTITFSGPFTEDDFDTSAGTIKVDTTIVGLKVFREELFVFGEDRIFKISGSSSSDFVVTPVTRRIGCVDGKSIQELGGDLIYLAPDGLRSIAGTERIGDVELGTVSKQIQKRIADIGYDNVTAVVIGDKSQYRLFYSDTDLTNASQKGIIGTLRPNGFEWSEMLGMEVTSIGSGFDTNGIEKYYHGDTNGYVYLHNSGDNFDGAAIDARYQTPDYDYGDFGTLKTLHYVKLSIGPENEVQPSVRVRFDYDSNETPQPEDNLLDSVPAPSIFGTALFGTAKFGASEHPLVRLALQGSGYSNSFRILTNDTNAPYTINGLYIDYIPSGRR